MGLYILRRLLAMVPVLILVSLIVFSLIHLTPGDPAISMLGEEATPQAVAALRTKLGLDQPIPVQYVKWLGSVLRGDLGRSIRSNQPVGEAIRERLPVTVELAILAMLVSLAIAIPAGIIAAMRRNSLLDASTTVVALLGVSLPNFFLAILLVLLFGLKLGWLPVVGYVSFAEDFGRALVFVVLPIATLTLIETGVITRMARASTIEVLRLEYITHARAKGVPESRVLMRHALPNAFAPTWTLIGLILGNLLGGIAVVETVFTIPGLGRLLVDSIFQRDYPVVQGCLLLTALMYVLVNLVVDLFYPLFDPRVSVE